MRFNKKTNSFEVTSHLQHIAVNLSNSQQQEKSKNDLNLFSNGKFYRIPNDFSTSDNCGKISNANGASRYQDESSWSSEKKRKVKRFRFVICGLALVGVAIAIMGRLVLNIAIVEMIRPPPSSEHEVVFGGADETTTTFSRSPDEIAIDSLLEENSATNPTKKVTPATQENAKQLDTYYDDGIHFTWTKKEVSIIIGCFYLAYFPSIMFGGSIAERYGAKYPLLFTMIGTSLINLLTPIVASNNIIPIVISRVLLSIVQGALLPSIYELFKNWLTATESSIFVPLIKVSVPFGSFVANIVPALFSSLGLSWPYLFYLSGLVCLLWSVLWTFLATSSPHDNRFVEKNELRRIMRKKVGFQGTSRQSILSIISGASDKKLESSSSLPTQPRKSTSSQASEKVEQQQQQKLSTPWFSIMTNPSILALALVKFTYNIAGDFPYLFLPVYLREMHNTPIEWISVVSGCGCLIQVTFITFIGWLAKTVVLRRTFGLSVTKWRKIFQGSSNFLMMLCFLGLAYFGKSFEISVGLLLAVYFFWMLGAGGESMVPFDLSSRYPASIMGFAHSVSILAGVTTSALYSSIVGEDSQNSQRWSLLFLVMSAIIGFGGLVFVLVLRAKPFLPEEVGDEPKKKRQKEENGTTTTMSSSPNSNGPV